VQALQETQQFSLEDTPTELFERNDKVDESTEEGDDLERPESGVNVKESGSKKHKKYKKLPVKEAVKSDSSKTAADDVLKKFFNRR